MSTSEEKTRIVKLFKSGGKSFLEASHLLLKYLPNNYIDENYIDVDETSLVYENYKSKIKDLTHLTLKQLVKKLEIYFYELLHAYLKFLKKKTKLQINELYKFLIVAQQLTIWRNGRKAFETNSSINNKKIKQKHEPVIDKFLSINFNDPWFMALPSWLQNFFIEDKKNLFSRTIPCLARYTPGLANAARYSFSIEDREELFACYHSATPVPIDLLLLENKQPLSRQEIARITCLNIATQIRVALQEKLDKLDTEKFDTSEAIHLPIIVQSLLSPLSSFLLRWAKDFFSNKSSNDSKIYAYKESAIALFQNALLNPEGLLKPSERIFAAFFFSDEQNPSYKDFLLKCELTIEGKYIRYEEKLFDINLISSNHAINLLRLFGETRLQKQINSLARINLFKEIANYLAVFKSNSLNQLVCNLRRCEFKPKQCVSIKNEIEKVLLENLDKAIKKVLDGLKAYLHALMDKGFGALYRGWSNHHQLFIAALELILVHDIGGIPWTGCKSGKDRTAVALNECLALKMFYHVFQRYPEFTNNKEMQGLFSFCAKFFKSGHHQRAAFTNSQIAEGIKNLRNLIPTGQIINSENVQVEERIADLNKPSLKKIKKFNHNCLYDWIFIPIKLCIEHFAKWIEKLLKRLKTLIQAPFSCFFKHAERSNADVGVCTNTFTCFL